VSDCVGCEMMCGECAACESVLWALKCIGTNDELADGNTTRVSRLQAFLAVTTIDALAELIGRAMKARGIDVEEAGSAHMPTHMPDYITVGFKPVRPFADRMGVAFYPAQGRVALLKLMVTPPSTPEDALRIVDEAAAAPARDAAARLAPGGSTPSAPPGGRS
jgi:hypothetical protein